MNPPEALRIKGEIADYYYSPEGILYSYSKDIKRTVENIRNNIALVKEITGGKKVPLLIYLTLSPVPNKETRKYSAEQLPNVYTAMAMISKGGLAQFIMNLLFKFKPPTIPMKTFSDDKEAVDWLKQFL
jgi:predicted S18 family serine protease